MKKTMIVSIICICLTLVSSYSAIAIPEEFDIVDEIKPQAMEMIESNNITIGDNLFVTVGPVSKFYTDVELTDGSPTQMNLVQRHLDRRLFRPLLIFKYAFVFVQNLSFTVEYKRDVSDRSRFNLMTINASIVHDENGSFENIVNYSYIINRKHSCSVENFTGIFLFSRLRIYDKYQPRGYRIFTPANIAFYGFCDELTFNQV